MGWALGFWEDMLTDMRGGGWSDLGIFEVGSAINADMCRREGLLSRGMAGVRSPHLGMYFVLRVELQHVAPRTKVAVNI